MSYEKIANVIDSLIVNTDLGKITWKESQFDKNSFEYSSSNSTITISKQQIGFDDWVISVEIYDKSGKKIESVHDSDLSCFFENSYHRMEGLFSVARRQALGVEQILDNLLKELPAVPKDKSTLKAVQNIIVTNSDELPF